MSVRQKKGYTKKPFHPRVRFVAKNIVVSADFHNGKIGEQGRQLVCVAHVIPKMQNKIKMIFLRISDILETSEWESEKTAIFKIFPPFFEMEHKKIA